MDGFFIVGVSIVCSIMGIILILFILRCAGVLGQGGACPCIARNKNTYGAGRYEQQNPAGGNYGTMNPNADANFQQHQNNTAGFTSSYQSTNVPPPAARVVPGQVQQGQTQIAPAVVTTPPTTVYPVTQPFISPSAQMESELGPGL